MSNKVKLALMIGGAAIFILLVIALLMRNGTTDVNNLNQSTNQLNNRLPETKNIVVNDNNAVVTTKGNATTITVEQKEEISLEIVSRFFAERFGTYSNQSNFENIKDLQYLMTEDVKSWSEKFISQGNISSDQYWGVTTKALAIKSQDIKADTAVIVVSTQRQEYSRDVNKAKIYKQDLKLEYVKSDGNWLISGVYWQ
ncbi:MAG: hypothetical protein WC310_00815 [Patescibacteria group bacterium]|jgi:hypothetical protein